jgi:glucokinase
LADLALGVDLGGTNIRVAIINYSGTIVEAIRALVGENPDPKTVIDKISEVIEQVLAKAAVDWQQIAGLGVGIAAQLRGASGVVAVAPNLGWREVPFGKMLSEKVGQKVRVVNDLEAIAWGEVSFGSARGHQNVLVVFLGTGVGAGVVIDGKLYQGSSGVAAEIGHVKVEDNGAPCGCSMSGCLEAYLGGANLSRLLQERAQNDWPALLGQAQGDLDAIHPGLVEELLNKNDPRAEELFDRLAGYLGTVLANATTLFNPSALVLGGTVLDGCPSLKERALKVFQDKVLHVAKEAVEILPAKLGSDAGIIGAGSLMFF